MWYGSRASWFNKQDGSASVKQNELDWIPTTGVDPVALELWAPRASRCATSVTSCSSALMHRCELSLDRRQVLILCPRGYEPRALPLRHAGEGLLRFTSSLTIVRWLESNQRPRRCRSEPSARLPSAPHRKQGCSSAWSTDAMWRMNTGDRFRSCDLGVMSPALFL